MAHTVSGNESISLHDAMHNLGSTLGGAVARLNAISTLLSRVGLDKLSAEIDDEVELIVLANDKVESAYSKYTKDVVTQAHQSTRNMVNAALAGVSLATSTSTEQK